MKNLLRNVLIISGILLLITGVWYFREIVVYILVSGVLSIIGRPLVDLICRIRIGKHRFPKALGALMTIIILWGLIILFFSIFVPLVSAQVQQLSSIDSSKIVRLVEEPIRRIESIFRALNQDISSDVSIKDYIISEVSGVLNVNLIQNIVSSLAGILGNILVAAFSITFITFFFLKDQHLFFETILIWVPDKYVEGVSHALYSIKRLLTRYFIGIMIQSTCIMILITSGMTIVGIDFRQAIVMGLIVGILNIIPYVGPWLGFFISVTMGVASHMNLDFNLVVLPLVWYMMIVLVTTQIIDNIVFQPVIFSNSVRAHPLEIFIVVLSAGFAAGVPGMILGIPTYTVLRVLAREFFYNIKAVQKLTSGLAREEERAGVIPRDERKSQIEQKKRVRKKTDTDSGDDQ
jgi:predicted PurR-regulated permease PerM